MSRVSPTYASMRLDLHVDSKGLRVARIDSDDTCGCTTETRPDSASSSTAVPHVAKAAASTVTAARDDLGVVPIACTLGAGERSSRLDEWNALLAHVAARHGLSDGLRVEFSSGTDVTEIAWLAGRRAELLRVLRRRTDHRRSGHCP
jgi:hypothetical protein